MAVDPNEIELTPELRRATAAQADETGKRWEELVSDALRAYSAMRSSLGRSAGDRSFYGAMMEDGAIGAVEDGLSTDLATNPNHVKGLGCG